MMTYKILALILILSNCIAFSSSTCKRSSKYIKRVWIDYTIVSYYYNALYCSNITSNTETKLIQEINNSNPMFTLYQVLEIDLSNISKIYDNTFDELQQYLTHVTLKNVSLCEIDANVFLKLVKLKSLIIPYNELTTIDFNLPPSMVYLNVSHNKLNHIKVPQNYNNLIELDLSYNSINSIENFEALVALEYLDLSHNNLSNLANITWKNEHILRSLILSHNNFGYISKNIETIFIKNLDISHNNISTFNCSHVSNSINLSYNKFTEICNLSKSIYSIDFSNNKITHIYEHTFKNLEDLVYLNLDNNYIETIYPGAFHDLISLKYLDLSDNILTELPLGLFYHLENLRNLYIAINYIEQFEHGIFTGLNRLQILNVSDNKIDNLDAVYSLKNLLELNIIDNNIYQLDVDQIIKHLPHLEKINFYIPKIACEELMVYILKFKTKNVEVEKGDRIYEENVNGMDCHSDPDKIKKESNNQRMGYIANYLSKISVALIVILVVLVFVIILVSFTLYRVYTKHRYQTEIDRNLHTCSLKLLSENDPLN